MKAITAALQRVDQMAGRDRIELNACESFVKEQLEGIDVRLESTKRKGAKGG